MGEVLKIEEGLDHHRAGRLAEAEKIYRALLEHHPDHADALHLLGVLTANAALIRRAIEIRPGVAEYHGNLGNILRSQRLGDAAIAEYITAAQLRPNQPELLNNLGNALREARRFDEAIAVLARAAQVGGQIAETHYNLGLALADAGKLDEAVAAYARAVQLKKNYAEAHCGSANALRDKGAVEPAIAAYHEAIRLKPDYVEAYSNLGSVLQVGKALDEAIACHNTAIRLKPELAEGHYNLGLALAEAGRLGEATDEYCRAIDLKPDFAAAHNNLGNVLRDQAKLDEAIASYERAMALEPGHEAYASNRLYAMLFHPGYDGPVILQNQKQWNEKFARRLMPAKREFTNDRRADRRLKIGYVSPGLSTHVVGRNILPLIREHDRNHFEIFCYSGLPHPDRMSARIRSRADHWRDIAGKPDTEVAEMVRGDQIDILVDLTLHMSLGRLLVFARRPAPVQVTFGGYPGGTGLDAMDYRLTDPHLDPAENDELYVEKSIRLPHSFWCYDEEGMSLAEAPDLPPLPADGAGRITFGCLNSFSKVNTGVVDLWGRVMARVPDSRLIVLSGEGPHQRMVFDGLARHGVSPDRIEVLRHRPRDGYLALHGKIDISLDTFPYNGHTTSLDSYWMGTPVVTLAGKTAVARAGWSQSCNLGLKELAAETPDDFVEIAVAVAGDLPRLRELHGTMRDRMKASPLMDAKGFARGIESAYRLMWRTWIGQ